MLHAREIHRNSPVYIVVSYTHYKIGVKFWSYHSPVCAEAGNYGRDIWL